MIAVLALRSGCFVWSFTDAQREEEKIVANFEMNALDRLVCRIFLSLWSRYGKGNGRMTKYRILILLLPPRLKVEVKLDENVKGYCRDMSLLAIHEWW